MKFVNREAELKFLNEKWGEDKTQLIVLYGKRRVGKTELGIQFAKNKPHLYFLCERIASFYQLRKFTDLLREYYHDDFLPKEGFGDWEVALKYIAQKDEKLLLIIDEFSYLAETDPAVPSTFQKAWDLYLKNSKIYLILSGSSISMMEKTLLHHKAPLYGRRTGQFLVKPFHFKELEKMFPSKGFEERLSIYSTVGGTPLYLNKFLSLKYIDGVKKNILTKGEPLYEEVEFLLREELKEPRNYFVILQALSLGKHKLSEIINETGLDKGTVSRYISILESIQITRKELPVTEKIPEKSRKGIYRIDDNFVHFWFQFVFKNRALLEENKIAKIISEIEEALPHLLARNYEAISSEILMESILKGDPDIPSPFEVCGRWWDHAQEIDLVALNTRTNEIVFGEVKWSDRPLGSNIYEDLKKKASRVIWGKNDRKEYFALFNKSGFTPHMKKIAREEKVLLFEKGDRLL